MFLNSLRSIKENENRNRNETAESSATLVSPLGSFPKSTWPWVDQMSRVICKWRVRMERPGLVSGGQPGKPLRTDTEKRSL